MSINRRDILKLTVFGFGAAAVKPVYDAANNFFHSDFFHSEEAIKTGANIALDLLRLIPKPGLSEALALDAEELIGQSDAAVVKNLPDSPRDLRIPNPDNRPIDLLINEAMKKYEKETGIRPVFKKVDNYVELDGWVEILKNSINSPDASLDMRDGSTKFMRTLIAENLGDGCKEKFGSVSIQTNSIWPLEGTSSDKFIQEELVNSARAGNFNSNPGVGWALNCRGEIFGKYQEPVSFQDQLVYFLGRNNGLVAPSLWDLYTYMKAEARINYLTGKGNYDDQEDVKKKKVSKFITSYIDQFSLHGNFSKFYRTVVTDSSMSVDYRECLDLSVYDKIGAFHHSIAIAALREFLPAEIIASLVIAANQIPGGNGGDSLSKSAADAYAASRVGYLELE